MRILLVLVPDKRYQSIRSLKCDRLILQLAGALLPCCPVWELGIFRQNRRARVHAPGVTVHSSQT